MTSQLAQSVMTILPKMERASAVYLADGDVLIHAPGFEDRTLAITDVEVSGKPSAVLLKYEPANALNRLNEVRASLSRLGVNCTDVDVLPYNRFSPDDFEARLIARLRAHHASRAVVDVSTMSKLAIMLVLHTCHQLGLRINVVYTEADHYGPTEEEYHAARRAGKIHQPSLHVFHGVHGVVRADSLASVAMQGQPTAAIVFMSFNDALTQLLLNTVYPGRLFLINGRPPIHSWREKATAWVHEQVRREWEDDNPVLSTDPEIPIRATSTLDYRESVDVLLELYWKLSTNHRVLLAPSGSKMQTVACALVKALHPDIHVEYPSPEGFAKEYSAGVGPRWSLELGTFDKLIGAIERAERKNFLEIAI